MSGKGAALVTGASARIGLSIARRLAVAGYAVVLHASPRSLSRAEAEAEVLRDSGQRAIALAADLADPASCADLVARADTAADRLSLLVNNAAIFEADTVETPDLELFERHIAINLRAPILLASAFYAQCRGTTDPSVVNVIDQKVLQPDASFFSYTLSKAALWTATQTMARSFAAKGVRVNAVGPGPVLPNRVEGQEGFANEVASVPLRQAVAPDEVAAAVLYLAEARSVTGQFLAVDAGQHLGVRA